MSLSIFIELVPGAGIEPARPWGRGILSPLRLPISPPGLRSNSMVWRDFTTFLVSGILLLMEARAGIEPASKALQASA